MREKVYLIDTERLGGYNNLDAYSGVLITDRRQDVRAMGILPLRENYQKKYVDFGGTQRYVGNANPFEGASQYQNSNSLSFHGRIVTLNGRKMSMTVRHGNVIPSDGFATSCGFLFANGEPQEINEGGSL